MADQAVPGITAFPTELPNREQLERFLVGASALTHDQWQQAQRDHDKPTLGARGLTYPQLSSFPDINLPQSTNGWLEIQPDSARPHCDFQILADAFGLGYNSNPSKLDRRFGPGLVPFVDAALVVAYRSDGQEPKEFIAYYAPFLRSIPLDGLGFSSEWMRLAKPSAHEPVVRAFEQILQRNVGRRVSPRSWLPDTPTNVEAAICFEAALNPQRRDQLGDELVELASFVADDDALEALSNPTGGIFEDVGDKELDAMTWIGTVDRDHLGEARSLTRGSAIPVGSQLTSRLAKASVVTGGAGCLTVIVAIVAWLLVYVGLPAMTALGWIPTLDLLGYSTAPGPTAWSQSANVPGWLVLLAWWSLLIVPLYLESRLTRRLEPLLVQGGWRQAGAVAAVLSIAIVGAILIVVAPIAIGILR